jgi:cytochrome oxidase assembly protein ShyY1
VDLTAVERPHEGTARGVLLSFPDVRDRGPDGSFRQRWFRLDGDAIRAQYPYPVAPLYLLDTNASPRGSAPATPAAATSGPPPPPTEAAARPVSPVPLDPPGLDSGPHLSYAFQWFSFAAIFLVGWFVLLVRRSDPDSRA